MIFGKDEYLQRLEDYNPGADKIPHDFLRFNPTELEGPLRELLHAEDTWTYVPLAHCKPWNKELTETKEEIHVREYIKEKKLNANHAAFVRERECPE